MRYFDLSTRPGDLRYPKAQRCCPRPALSLHGGGDERLRELNRSHECRDAGDAFAGTALSPASPIIRRTSMMRSLFYHLHNRRRSTSGAEGRAVPDQFQRIWSPLRTCDIICPPTPPLLLPSPYPAAPDATIHRPIIFVCHFRQRFSSAAAFIIMPCCHACHAEASASSIPLGAAVRHAMPCRRRLSVDQRAHDATRARHHRCADAHVEAKRVRRKKMHAKKKKKICPQHEVMLPRRHRAYIQQPIPPPRRLTSCRRHLHAPHDTPPAASLYVPRFIAHHVITPVYAVLQWKEADAKTSPVTCAQCQAL